MFSFKNFWLGFLLFLAGFASLLINIFNYTPNSFRGMATTREQRIIVAILFVMSGLYLLYEKKPKKEAGQEKDFKSELSEKNTNKK